MRAQADHGSILNRIELRRGIAPPPLMLIVATVLATMSDSAVTIATGDDPPGPVPAWITPALLALTIEVWSDAYGRPVGVGEAVELLTNVKRLGEALIRARRESG